MTTMANSLDIDLHRTSMILDKTESLRQLADYRFGHNPDAVLEGTSVAQHFEMAFSCLKTQAV
jgi:hypothetical protein